MKDKPYTVEQEQIARFAKAMGHPARMAILAFLANQESCFFGDIRYCINRENWELARKLFTTFLGDCQCKGTSCCE